MGIKEAVGKILPLESLRGLAAFTVVIDHFFRTFYPYTFVDTQPQHSHFETWFINTPLFVFINGAFSVMIFFVLSGFVLSHSYFKHRDKFDFIAASIKRYFRLTPVVIISVLIAFLLLKLHLFYNSEAGLMPASWKNDNVTFLNALWEGMIGIYILPVTDKALNSVLWTIYYEMIGSIIVFAVLAMVGSDKRRFYVYALLTIILFGTNFIGFIVGLILADLYNNRPYLIAMIAKLSTFYKVMALSTAIYLASFPPLRTVDNLSLIHRPLLFLDNYALNQTILHATAAIIIILLLISTRRLNKVFAVRPLVYLGKISYSMYATHLLVLGSVTSYTFYTASQNQIPYNQAALLSGLVYLPTVFIVAILVTKYVDTPSILLSRKVGKIFAKMGNK